MVVIYLDPGSQEGYSLLYTGFGLCQYTGKECETSKSECATRVTKTESHNGQSEGWSHHHQGLRSGLEKPRAASASPQTPAPPELAQIRRCCPSPGAPLGQGAGGHCAFSTPRVSSAPKLHPSRIKSGTRASFEQGYLRSLTSSGKRRRKQPEIRVPSTPQRRPVPAPRRPPQSKLTAERSVQGLPGPETPAAGPAPPSLPLDLTLGKLQAPPLPGVRGRKCTSRSPAPPKQRQPPPPPPPFSIPAGPARKGWGKGREKGERGRPRTLKVTRDEMGGGSGCQGNPAHERPLAIGGPGEGRTGTYTTGARRERRDVTPLPATEVMRWSKRGCCRMAT